jgi:hypothetical protein
LKSSKAKTANLKPSVGKVEVART